MAYIFIGGTNTTTITFDSGSSSSTALRGWLMGKVQSVTTAHKYNLSYELFYYYTSTTISRLGTQNVSVRCRMYESSNSPIIDGASASWNTSSLLIDSTHSYSTSYLSQADPAPSLGSNWHGIWGGTNIPASYITYTVNRSKDTRILMRYDTSNHVENGSTWKQHGTASSPLSSVVYAYNSSTSKWVPYVPFVYTSEWKEAVAIVYNSSAWKECYP